MTALGHPRHERQYLAPGNPNAPFLVPRIDTEARSLGLPPLGGAAGDGDEETAAKRRVRELGGRRKERDGALLEVLARARAAEERAAYWEARYRAPWIDLNPEHWPAFKSEFPAGFIGIRNPTRPE